MAGDSDDGHLLMRHTFESASHLLVSHPPSFTDPKKALLHSLARRHMTSPGPPVTVSRWRQLPLDSVTVPAAADALTRVAVVPEPYSYSYSRASVPPAAADVHWHVNFADTDLFAFYSGPLFAQDEIMCAEHPTLPSVREALLALRLPALPPRTRSGAADPRGGPPGAPTPILITGAERTLRIEFDRNAAEGRPHGLYGNRFQLAAPEAVEAAARELHPAEEGPPTNVVAMEAPRPGCGAYGAAQLADAFSTALSAFRAARRESDRLVGPGAGSGSGEERGRAGGGGSSSSGRAAADDRCEPLEGSEGRPAAPDRERGDRPVRVVVHTGHWGCGAWGGNKVAMALLQVAAARAAGCDQLVYHAFDSDGARLAERGLGLLNERWRASGSWQMFLEFLLECRFERGMGDGN